MTEPDDRYVLVTAARDAAPTIGRTIDAVADQTHLPAHWVVASDGSVDGTEAVVEARAADLPWLTLVRTDRAGPRSFAGKVAAIRAAYAVAARTPHAVVANLDADVVVPPRYYETCIERLRRQPGLGITGGTIVETRNGCARPQRSARWSVAGAVQVFRRECWQQVGGYLPLSSGGEDALAEVLARAAGYEVAVIPDLTVAHDGAVLGGAEGVLGARARRGRMHWEIGYDPWFQLASALARVTEAPVALGSVATLGGYAWAALRGVPRSAPPTAVAALREQQRARLRRAACGAARVVGGRTRAAR